MYADETRPVLQGARLTASELRKEGIPSILICDDMAALVMKTKKIDAIIVGADRIAANGDTANKIGTYGLAILAAYHLSLIHILYSQTAAPGSNIVKDVSGTGTVRVQVVVDGSVIQDREL